MAKNKKKTRANHHLPNDIITSILELLPVRSLLRFLCASKAFCSEICSSTFVCTHLKRSISISNTNNKHSNSLYHFTSNGNLALCPEGESPAGTVYDLPCDINDTHFLKIVGSCNGVICLFDSMSDHFFLWNPLLNRTVKQKHATRYLWESTDLIFGFGYDPIQNDYKLIHVNAIDFLDEVISRLYTLSSNAWRIHDNVPPKKFKCFNDSQSPLYINGACHWLVEHHSCSVWILSFHMGDEVFRELDLPDSLVSKSVTSLQVNAFDGLLCVVSDECEIMGLFSVWAMKEYDKKESWVKLVNVSAPLSGYWRVLGLRKEGQVLIAHGYGANKELYLCQKNTRKRRQLHLADANSHLYWGTYVETLALLDVEQNENENENENEKNGTDIYFEKLDMLMLGSLGR